MGSVSIFCDGTRNRNNIEQLDVALRYVKETLKERLLTVVNLSSLDANSIAHSILDSLRETELISTIPSNELASVRIISQCYDGASVMAGKYGGVQQKLQELLWYKIPYIHCFSHQLHLVIVHVLSSDKQICNYFEIANALYNFTQHY